jgi:glucosamine-6-phosphate deaminase
MIRSFTQDLLTVNVFENRSSLGSGAAQRVGKQIRHLLEKQEQIQMIFAAAPSQLEFLNQICELDHIPWERVNAFHLDEYLGLEKTHPSSFGYFLDQHLFTRLPFREIHYLHGDAQSPAAECLRYSHLLKSHPPDILCLGIGENGHLAFNDPPVADFQDPDWVKTVELEEACRLQQVHDGCFPSLEQVPKRALTLTIPALMSCPYLYAMVPGPTKARAVRDTLHQKIRELFPSTILRTHPRATLFLDPDSSSLL